MWNLSTFLLITFAILSLFISPLNADGCWAAPFTYGPKCNGTTAVFGEPGLVMGYTITAIENTGTQICCKVKGFNKKQEEKWKSIGCGHTKITGKIPWGNVLASRGVQCKGIPFGAMVNFNG